MRMIYYIIKRYLRVKTEKGNITIELTTFELA